jgi:hypothetical protein
MPETQDSVTPESLPAPGRWTYAIFLVVATILTFVFVVLVFTPRFILWTGLEPGVGAFNPEINRAIDSLRQLDYPFTEIENQSNAVIHWRLLFPILGHLLHLPRIVYLALPFLGCLLVIALMLHVFTRESGCRLQAWLASTLLATTSWFFTSTGWLAYFDSWYVLGMVVVSFIDSRKLMVLSCLLTPWVDERFVLSLPLCLVVRAVRLGYLTNGSWRKFAADILYCTPPIALVCIVRVIASVTGEATSTSYIAEHVTTMKLALENPEVYFIGWWNGLRLGWVGVGLFVFLTFCRKEPVRTIWILSITTLTLAVAVFVAGDIGRSMAQLTTAAMLGFMLLAGGHGKTQRAKRVTFLLTALVVLNLVLPAKHVVTSFIIPIRPIDVEIERARNPPYYLVPAQLVELGLNLQAAGDYNRAFEQFTLATRVDPGFIDAYYRRGEMTYSLDDMQNACADFSRLLVIAPAGWVHEAEVRALKESACGAPQEPAP